LLLFATLVFAQKSKVKDAEGFLKNNKPDEAKKSIEMALDGVDDDKTMESPDTWYIRGKVYLALYEKKPEKNKTALKESVISYKKCLEFFEKESGGKGKEYENMIDIKESVAQLEFNLKDEAEKNLGAKNYAVSLEFYETYLELCSISILNRTDSAIIYKCGIISKNSGNADKAITFFDKCIEMKYLNSMPYQQKAICQMLSNNTKGQIETLKTGIEKNPATSVSLINELMINYMKINKLKDFTSFLAELENKYTSQPAMLALIGYSYTQIGKQDKGNELIKKAYQYNQESFETNFFMGEMYYQQAIQATSEADKLEDSKESEKNQKLLQAQNIFKQSLPHFEKAYKSNKKDLNVIQKLQTVYRKTEKWNESMKMKKLYEELSL